jgi:iron complex transport system substrate-binding protein
LRGFVALLAVGAALCAAEPRRIVSTAPSITETLFALGLGQRVVGVTTYCRYPPEVTRLPKIGTFLEPNFERILALKPDLVFTMKNPVQLTERLRGLKLNAVELDEDTVEGVFTSIERIGQATEAQSHAKALAESLHGQLDTFRKSTAALPARSVLFIIGRTPGTLEGLIGAGKGSYLDQLLAYAGGRNVLADAPMAYPKVSLEEILARDPEVILDMGDFEHASGEARERQQEVAAIWAKYPLLRAVKTHRVYALSSDIFVVPGPRMADAAREFRRLLHPEAQ